MLPALYALRAVLRAVGPILTTGGFIAGLLMLGMATGTIEPLALLEDLLRSLIGI